MTERGQFLGRTGLEVGRLCLGTMTFGWTADKRTSFRILDAATEADITFFDTANMYSTWVEGNVGGESERILGEWLAKRGERHKLVIATKVRGRMWAGHNGEGLGRAHILRAVEDSLRRLQTDTIDLLQAHWYDEHTPLDETLSAFEALVRDGKVRYIGASNHPAWRLTKALWRSDVGNYPRYDSLQPHYSLLHRAEYETELRDLCADQGIGVLPYSPLAAGFLTGKYTRDDDSVTGGFSGRTGKYQGDEGAHQVVDAVREIAAAHDVPPAQVALAWLLAQPTVTAPIVGARTPEQLTEVVGALSLRLTDDELTRLTTASEGY